MKRYSTLLIAFFTSLCLSAQELNVGDTFTATVHGVSMTFKVTLKTNRLHFAQVYGEKSSPAIPKATTGTIIIPTFVKLNDGTEWDITGISKYAFYNCANIESVIFEDGNAVSSIGEEAFKGCKNLVSVTGMQQVLTISRQAFTQCSNLEKIDIPEILGMVGANAFQLCSNMERVNISNLDAWQDISFYNGTSNPLYYARRLYLNGNEVKDLEIAREEVLPYTFIHCESLENLTFVGTASKSIGKQAFSRCKNLNIDIEFPASMDSIADNAFSECETLKSITLNENLRSIGKDAFNKCYGITDIYCSAAPIALEDHVFGPVSNANSAINTATLHTPVEYLNEYLTSEKWNVGKKYASSLTDGESYKNTSSITPGADQDLVITYNRNYNNTNWQALFIPFDVDYATLADKYEVAEIMEDANGFSGKGIGFTTINGGTIKANTPYIIRALETGAHPLETSVLTLAGAEDIEPYSSGICTFTGVFEPFYGMYSIGGYALANGKFSPARSTSAKLNPYRWYMTIDEAKAEALGIDVKQFMSGISVVVDKETGIESSVKLEEDSTTWYNLAGQKVSAPTKGIYVSNGKKVLF